VTKVMGDFHVRVNLKTTFGYVHTPCSEIVTLIMDKIIKRGSSASLIS
jgi:hypothetical protein